MRGKLGRVGESLYGGCLEQLGEEKGVWSRGGADDEVGGGAGRGGGFRKSEEGL